MTDEIKTIGDSLPPLTGATVLTAPSTDDLDLTSLPARLDDETLARVEVIASSPLQALEKADSVLVDQCLKMLKAALPRQRSDDASGELVLVAYERVLRDYPADAINYLADKALVRLKWFPVISECVQILSEWQRSDGAPERRKLAGQLVERERTQRFEDAMEMLRGNPTQEQIDALPERWLKIAEARMILYCDRGTYIPRKTMRDRAA